MLRPLLDVGGRSRAFAAERGSGSVVSVEHDRAWAALVNSMLSREKLNEVARVVDVPLDGDPPWYAAAALDALPTDVDLLVVDGPPAHRRTRRLLDRHDARPPRAFGVGDLTNARPIQ